jgi:hypothetical protein
VVLPNGLEEIRGRAFGYSQAMTGAQMGMGPKEAENAAFHGCPDFNMNFLFARGLKCENGSKPS